MLTPQEITDKTFEKVLIGGYDMATVERFIDEVAKDYSDLYKENAVLKNKMKVLVDKIEEYRSTEDSMHVAILNAQKMAKEIVEKAEADSNSIVETAQREADEQIQAIHNQVREEEMKLDKAKEVTAGFVRSTNELIGKQLEFLNKLNEYIPSEYMAKAEERSSEEKRLEQEEKDEEVGKIYSRIIEDMIDEEPVSSESVEDGKTKIFKIPATEGKKTKYDFDDLKFGDDYDATE